MSKITINNNIEYKLRTFEYNVIGIHMHTVYLEFTDYEYDIT